MTKIYTMSDWNAALVETAKTWDVRISQMLFDIIDSIKWNEDAVLSFDKRDECLTLLLTDDNIFRVEMFGDASLAVYAVDQSGENENAITAMLEDLPAIMKMYNLLVLDKADDIDD